MGTLKPSTKILTKAAVMTSLYRDLFHAAGFVIVLQVNDHNVTYTLENMDGDFLYCGPIDSLDLSKTISIIQDIAFKAGKELAKTEITQMINSI